MEYIEQTIRNRRHGSILSVYCPAGFPSLNSLPDVLLGLQSADADMIEVGIPYSDPVADGPTLQHASTRAIGNGMTPAVLFDQLDTIRSSVHIPILLMGYVNSILQYGVENFFQRCARCGVAGLIVPDLPIVEYERVFREHAEKYKVGFSFLVSPRTDDARVRMIDMCTNGFLYAVSMPSVTGGAVEFGDAQRSYLDRLRSLELRHPVLVGFGIHDRASFAFANTHAQGAIIGSAFVRHLDEHGTDAASIERFVRAFRT